MPCKKYELNFKKHEEAASFSCQGRKNLGIYSWYSLPDLKHDQKRFIRILPKLPRNEAFRHYIFPRTVQSFITIKWQEKCYQ